MIRRCSYHGEGTQRVSQVLDRVRSVAKSNENIMPVLIEAVKAYAMVGGSN